MKKQIVGVYGFILNSQEQFLIIQRSKKDSSPGLWELPGGGIDFGEKMEDAAKREVKEEVGLDVKVIHPLTVVSDTEYDTERQFIRIVYFCKLKNEAQKVTLSQEHTDYIWISLDEYYDTKKTNMSRAIMSQVKANEIVNDILHKVNTKK